MIKFIERYIFNIEKYIPNFIENLSSTYLLYFALTLSHFILIPLYIKFLGLNSFGELMFLRSRYGHGGRIGYDKEWRAKPMLSGGGELIDQGSHLIDLSRYFFRSS